MYTNEYSSLKRNSNASAKDSDLSRSKQSIQGELGRKFAIALFLARLFSEKITELLLEPHRRRRAKT